MEIFITGASGLIGSALVPALVEAGHRPVRLVRRDPKPGGDEIRWNPDDGQLDAASLEGADAVINLSGAGIADRRWNDAYRRLLVSSRVVSTSLVASTIAGLDRPPSVLLSASAIGYYGDRGDELLTERSGPGTGFLTDLVTRWEAATQPAVDAGIRTALCRAGIVFSTEGGALPKLILISRLGLGGRVGSGRQYQSWITIDDAIEALLHLLTSSVAGPVNLTAPEPTTNAKLGKALGTALRRPSFVVTPSFGPRLLLGRDMARALLLDSQRIIPEVLTNSGYEFLHRNVVDGLAAVLAEKRP